MWFLLRTQWQVRQVGIVESRKRVDFDVMFENGAFRSYLAFLEIGLSWCIVCRCGPCLGDWASSVAYLAGDGLEFAGVGSQARYLDLDVRRFGRHGDWRNEIVWVVFEVTVS